MSIMLTVIIILISLLLQAFFSGIEIGIISISKIKLLKKIKQGSNGAVIINKLLHKPENLLGTTLIGTNISIVISSSLLTGLLYKHFPHFAEYLSLIILTPLILIFCEAIPKAVFREYKNSITVSLAPLLQISYYIFYPIVFLVTGLSKILIRIIQGSKVESNPFITRDELKIITIESYPGTGDEALRKIARRIFYFGEKNAKSIMLDLNNAAMIEKTQTVGELKELFSRVRFSKYPVYSRKKENIIGFINIKDVLAVGDNKRVSGFIRDAHRVNEDIGLEDLLTIFRRGAEQMVLVYKEDNEEITGILTLEDVLEELVGDIKDEYELK